MVLWHFHGLGIDQSASLCILRLTNHQTETNYHTACTKNQQLWSSGSFCWREAAQTVHSTGPRALRKTHASGKTTQGTFQFALLTIVSPRPVSPIGRNSWQQKPRHLYMALLFTPLTCHPCYASFYAAQAHPL